MNYLEQYCQRANGNDLKVLGLIFVSLFFLGCSSDPKPEPVEIKAKSVLAEPVWFNAPDRFKQRTSLFNVVTHPFFDLTPFRTKENKNISYFLLTKSDSAHQYNLDISSGQLYRKRTYCEQSDIWESYEEKIFKPPFHIGLVPRLLDQTGEPQNIWVFGQNKHIFSSYLGDRAQSQRARVVGGLILQYCQNYPCNQYQNWLSRLILVGVNPFDPKFKDVTNLSQLQKKVDWKYVKAFAQNGFGRTLTSTIPEPAYRLVGNITADKALDVAFKAGHYFSFGEINSLRKNCYYLYDYLWRSVKKVRSNMKKKRLADDQKAVDLRKKAEEIRRAKKAGLRRVFSDDIRKEVDKDKESAEAKRALVDFQKFFLYFYNKYGERFNTCTQFVKPANHKENSERFWFFAFMENWFNLEGLNYYYLCPRRSWLENARLANGKRRFDPKAERRCSNEELDESFSSGITVMASLANSGQPHYRFYEFDNGIGGSHKELYSWVYDNGKKLGCNARELEETPFVFPSDVEWNDFKQNTRRNLYDVIR